MARDSTAADCVTKYICPVDSFFICQTWDQGSHSVIKLFCTAEGSPLFDVPKYPASWKTPTGYGLEVEYYQ